VSRPTSGHSGVLGVTTRKCAVEGCTTDCPVGGPQGRICYKHAARIERHGDPDAVFRPFEKKNGRCSYRYPTPGGYTTVYDPDTQTRKLEHRLVMEAQLARPLRPDENVHHINGVRTDNRPENLELWVTHQPSGQRPEDLIAWAREILERYA